MRTILLILIFISINYDIVDSSNERDGETRNGLSVLLITGEEAGHSIPMLSLGEALVDRGHRVTLLVLQANMTRSNVTMINVREWCEDRRIEFRSAGVIDVDIPMDPEGILAAISAVMTFIPIVGKMHQTVVDKVKHDSELLESMDVVVIDFLMVPVLEWLNTNTNLTVFSLTLMIPYYTNTQPSWYFPTFPTNSDGPVNPTFFDRTKRVVLLWIFHFLVQFIDNPIKHLLLPTDVPSGVRNPTIVATSFGFDYPRPLYPLVHYVGPMVSRTNKPLSNELEEWLGDHSTPRSVVYLSMGSMLTPKGDAARNIVHGIMESGYDLLWSLRDKKHDILQKIDSDYINSGRILISKWLPQPVVLQHPSISLAVLHGGFGGIHEALLGGVPIVCLPGIFDQSMNCGRVQNQGLGVNLGRMEEISVAEVKQAISNVENKTCRENVKKISLILKRAGGTTKAVDLIEYYHEMGYDHLIPAWSKYKWSSFQYYNLDVFLVLCVVICLSALMMRRACCYCCKPLCEDCFRKTLKTD